MDFPTAYHRAHGHLLCPNGDKVRSDEQGLFCMIDGQRVPYPVVALQPKTVIFEPVVTVPTVAPAIVVIESDPSANVAAAVPVGDSSSSAPARKPRSAAKKPATPKKATARKATSRQKPEAGVEDANG